MKGGNHLHTGGFYTLQEIIPAATLTLTALAAKPAMDLAGKTAKSVNKAIPASLLGKSKPKSQAKRKSTSKGGTFDGSKHPMTGGNPSDLHLSPFPFTTGTILDSGATGGAQPHAGGAAQSGGAAKKKTAAKKKASK